MEIPTKIYLKANPPYWFDISHDKINGSPFLVRLDLTRELGNGSYISNEIELKQVGIATHDKGKFIIYRNKELIVVSKKKGLLDSIKKEDLYLMKMWGEATSLKFRNQTKSKLITSLSNSNNVDSKDTVMSAFRDYTNFDAYSVWLYNDITNAFTRIDGDVNPRTYFVKETDYNILARGRIRDKMICGELNSNSWKSPDAIPPDLTWVNVFSVSKSTSNNRQCLTAVVCMYSRNNGYNLRSDTCSLIRSFQEQNLANSYFDRIFHLNNVRTQLGLNLDPQLPTEFLKTVVESVATELQWESCSIFLADNYNKSTLLLKACYPESKKNNQLEPVSYRQSDKSMTTLVFRENEMLWSYDIQNDSRNSHTFDDSTETQPRDWVGVPIVIPGSNPIGVLRVKNRKRVSGKGEPYFCSLDMLNIQAVSYEIASILHQFDMYSERKQLADQRTRELKEKEDFLKTFRHEIRSPIQAVGFAPECMGIILRDEGIISHNSVPKKLLEFLSDLKATGDRLEMICKALTLNPDEIVKDEDFRICNVYKECVAPVLAFSKSYARKKKRYINEDKDSLLINMNCNAVAISMAFHALVDNAIKYSDKGTIIAVYGKTFEGGLRIIVENTSEIFTLVDENFEQITSQYIRGNAPQEQKLEGSGIGLFFARRIMELHGGRLELLNRKSPVKFALTLKN